MLPINPRDMEKALKRMGIKMETIDAKEVIIKCGDKEILINDPVVQKVDMKGMVSFQIQGSVEERKIQKEKFTQEDVELVVEKTGVSREEAKKALENADGDIAEAILKLSGE